MSLIYIKCEECGRESVPFQIVLVRTKGKLKKLCTLCVGKYRPLGGFDSLHGEICK